jgi:hypothetical protein
MSWSKCMTCISLDPVFDLAKLCLDQSVWLTSPWIWFLT